MSPQSEESDSNERGGALSIAALGSVAFDTIETPADTRHRLLGGSATHFAVAVQLFTSVRMISVVGDDFGPKDDAVLRSLGIDIALVERRKGPTYAWHGRYGGDYANATTVARDVGVIDEYTTPAEWQHGCGGLFLGAMDPTIQRSLLDRSSKVSLTALDSRESWIAGAPDQILKLASEVDFVFVNTFELMALTGHSSPERGATDLMQRGARCVIVKRGERGASLCTPERILSVPAHRASVVDPTGAGDAFAGGFIGVLARGDIDGDRPLEEALRYGAATASFAVEGFGIEPLVTLGVEDLQRRADSIECREGI
jgi:sugar/nucleoside kinase (ribokinase family)